jgi:hypothetical protein
MVIPSFVTAPSTINVTTMADGFCNGSASGFRSNHAKP